MKRIVMLSLVLALLGALVLSTAAFAGGPHGVRDGSGPIGGGQWGAGEGNGSGYGPGDGSCPCDGEGYGPGSGAGGKGPGTCTDLNHNGICDCRE